MKTKKNRKLRGGFFGTKMFSDNNLVQFPTNCFECEKLYKEMNYDFQLRKGTIGKSKTANTLTNFVAGVFFSVEVGDISVNFFFCN